MTLYILLTCKKDQQIYYKRSDLWTKSQLYTDFHHEDIDRSRYLLRRGSGKVHILLINLYIFIDWGL